MTYETIVKKMKEVQDSTAWNYVLIFSAALTFVIAARNISKYVSDLRSLKAQANEAED